jgi:copper chaperone
MAVSTYRVEGMTCGHCAGAVQGEVGRLPGVADVAVDVEAGQVTVTSADPLDLEAVRAAVEEAGYAMVG